MPQSFSDIRIHVVFTTLERRPYMDELRKQERVHAFLGGICKQLACPATVVGGVADHVHLLASLNRTTTVADLVRDLKRASSTWAKQHIHHEFSWQAGYGAFSVSPLDANSVIQYIANQADHHKVLSFQDEFREILRQHGLEWDERYIWD